MRQVLAVRAKGLPTVSQWRQLPRFLSVKERQIAAFALLIAILTGGTLGTRAFLSGQTVMPAHGGSYIEGAIGTPRYINPLYAPASDIDSDLSRLVYSGLLRQDPQEGLIPDLATSFQVSEDQKTYTFTLRDNAKWHDGSPVTAADVIFTITAIQNPEYHSPLAVSFAGVIAEQIDEHTVQFTLDEPFSPFLATLTVGILPSHLWQDVAPSNAQLHPRNINPVGSGPYKFKKLAKDSMGNLRWMTFEANGDFYRGEPYISELTFKFYGDVTQLAEAVRNKNVEGASVIISGDVNSLAHDGDITLVNPTLPQYTAAFFNQKNSTVLADDSVRSALLLAVDRQTITSAAYGTTATPIVSPILSGMPGYIETTIPTADTASAAAKLDAAGWTFTEGATVRSKNDQPLAFTITTLTSPELATTAQELERQWEALGASVDVAYVDTTTLQTDILKNRSYDVLITGERYGSYPDPYPFWHSSQTSYPGLNLGGFSVRSADEAIEAARTTTDTTKRAEAFTTLATAIAEEMPAVILYQPAYTFALSSHIKGVEVPSVTVPSDRFADIEQWHIKTKRSWN